MHSCQRECSHAAAAWSGLNELYIVGYQNCKKMATLKGIGPEPILLTMRYLSNTPCSSFLGLFVCLSVWLYTSVCLFVCLYVCLFVWLVGLFVHSLKRCMWYLFKTSHVIWTKNLCNYIIVIHIWKTYLRIVLAAGRVARTEGTQTNSEPTPTHTQTRNNKNNQHKQIEE